MLNVVRGIGNHPMERRRAFAVLPLLGAVALLAALFLGWYTISGEVGGSHLSDTFYPFWVQLGSPSSTSQSSYASAGLANTGNLYLGVSVSMLCAIVLGVVVCVFTALGSVARRKHTVLLISLIALAFALAAPIAVAVGQSTAVCSDSQHFSPPLVAIPSPAASTGATCTWEFDSGGVWYGPGQPSGPENSFVGQSSLYNGSLSWGPSIGWYLAFIGAGFTASAPALGSFNRTSVKTAERAEA